MQAANYTVCTLVAIAITAGSISLAFSVQATAQQSVSTYVNIHNPSARSASMAYAGVADHTSIMGRYANPASPVFMRNPLMIEAALYYDSSVHDVMSALALPLFYDGTNFVSAGVYGWNARKYLKGGTPLNLSDRPVSYYRYDLGYARKLGDKVSIGMQVAAGLNKMDTSRVWNFTQSVGIFYDTAEYLTYGLVYKGSPGSSYYRQRYSPDVIEKQDIPHSLEMGITYRFPTYYREPYFVVSIANKKVFGRSGLLYKVGFEMSPISSIGLRVGFLSGPDQKKVNMGFGFQQGEFRIDYAYELPITTHVYKVHQFSIAYEL